MTTMMSQMIGGSMRNNPTPRCMSALLLAEPSFDRIAQLIDEVFPK